MTAGTATAGNAQVPLTWTNPGDADLGTIVVLRRASAAVASTPTEGATYAVGNTIGSSTVACVIAVPTASCIDSGLTNGTAYHYEVFARDTVGNYATGVVPAGTVPPDTDLAYTISLTNAGGSAATSVVLVDSLNTRVDYKLGSVVFNPGTSGLTDVVAWSNDGGSTYTYVPASGAGGAPAGYDRTVTNVRWTFTGNLSHTAPANTASVELIVRIR